MATTTMPAAKAATTSKPRSTAKVHANRQPATREVNSLEYFTESPPINKEQGVVSGVKLLGRISKNGHRYSDQAIRDAAKLYDGVTVNRNHPPERQATAERLVEEPFGVIRNPVARITGDDITDGVYGDHHYPLKDAWTPTYEEKVERFPTTLGFSHNAVITESVRDGVVTYESVQRARSVDLVANPATTRGVFESEEGNYMDNDPNAAGAADPNAVPADGAGEAEEQTTEDKLRAALLASISAILEDDSIPFDDAKKKVVTLMDAHNDATSEEGEGEGEGEGSGDGEGSGSGSADDDGKKDDTASLRDRLSKLEKEIKAKNALESARAALEKEGMRPATWQVKAFSVLESEDERKAFIADAKAKPIAAINANGTPVKPRSTSANALESQRQAAAAGNGNGNGGIALPKTRDDLQALTYELMRP